MNQSPFLYLFRAVALAVALTFAPAGAASAFDAREAPRKMLILTETDNDRTVDIHAGDEVQVNLHENASTGYRWTVDSYDRDILEELPAAADYPAGGVGSAGTATFTFRGRKAGVAAVGLKLRRRWEAQGTEVGVFRVKVRVGS